MSRFRSLIALGLLAVLSVLPVTALAASDPYRPQQWGLDRIGISDAWGVTRGEGMIIAVVDSGIDAAHDDLAPQLLRDDAGTVVGRDFVDDDDDPTDRNGHGTMVSGIAAAATGNGIGVAGTAPGTKIMPLRVLDEDGEGNSRDVDAAIRWAVDHGADVVNLSLESEVRVAGTDLGTGAQAPVDAVRYAWDRGVIVVAASGNSGNPFTDYPDDSPVVLVGASDRDDEPAGFSDGGRRDAVLAPGIDIVSTWCVQPPDPGCDGTHHTYGEADGTSFAAPFVSGTLALLRANGLTHEQAVQRLRESADDIGEPGPDPQSGYGIVNAGRALRTPAPDPSPPPESPPSPTPSPSPPNQTQAGESPDAASSPPAGQTATPPTPQQTDPSPAPTGEQPAGPSPAPSPPTVAAPTDPGGDQTVPGLLQALTALLVVGAGATWELVRRSWEWI